MTTKKVRFDAKRYSDTLSTFVSETISETTNEHYKMGYNNRPFSKASVLRLAYVQLSLCFFAVITQLIILQLSVEFSKLSAYGDMIAREFFLALIFGLPGGIGIWVCRRTYKFSVIVHVVYSIIAFVTFCATFNFSGLGENMRDPLYAFTIIFNVGQVIISMLFVIIDGKTLHRSLNK